jgi:hypothetical protein
MTSIDEDGKDILERPVSSGWLAVDWELPGTFFIIRVVLFVKMCSTSSERGTGWAFLTRELALGNLR